MVKDFKRIKTIDAETERIQDNIAEFTKQLVSPFLSANIIKDVVISTTFTDVAHGLGRIYQGWQIVDIQGDARVWRDTASIQDKTKFITLRSSATVTVSLRVF